MAYLAPTHGSPTPDGGVGGTPNPAVGEMLQFARDVAVSEPKNTRPYLTVRHCGTEVKVQFKPDGIGTVQRRAWEAWLQRAGETEEGIELLFQVEGQRRVAGRLFQFGGVASGTLARICIRNGAFEGPHYPELATMPLADLSALDAKTTRGDRVHRWSVQMDGETVFWPHNALTPYAVALRARVLEAAMSRTVVVEGIGEGIDAHLLSGRAGRIVLGSKLEMRAGARFRATIVRGEVTLRWPDLKPMTNHELTLQVSPQPGREMAVSLNGQPFFVVGFKGGVAADPIDRILHQRIRHAKQHGDAVVEGPVSPSGHMGLIGEKWALFNGGSSTGIGRAHWCNGTKVSQEVVEEPPPLTATLHRSAPTHRLPKDDAIELLEALADTSRLAKSV